MRLRPGLAVLSLAFVLTGVGTALLGAALPAMLAEWHLNDRSGGWLLFSAFAGSTLGASLVQRGHRLIAAAGLAASASAMLFLSLSHHGPFRPAFLLYGLGLGSAMTAISLLRSREVPVDESTLEMNRLNLLWAIGACFAPALALHSLHLVSVNTLFRAESAALALAAIALLLTSGRGAGERPRAAPPPTRAEPFAPLRMCLFAGAAVGLETAVGSWLTTYTQRVAHGTGIAVWANSAFWVGLLLSRAAHSVRAGYRLHTRPGIAAHLALIGVATALLVTAPVAAALPLGALLAGLGLGPLYPLVLSLCLPRYRSGLVFVMAGVGAAVLPWLTGVISTTFGSLRAGLIAPCATVFLLLISTLWIWREIPDYAAVPTPVIHNV